MKVIDDDRMAHMHGVAEYMYEHADEYNLFPEDMYVLGLLHDIGYMSEEKEHEAYSSNILGDLGFNDDLISVVYWHGTTPENYKIDNHCEDSDIPLELILLWRANMHVDLFGEDVGYDDKIAGVEKVYGKDSDKYKDCLATIKWLKENGHD